MNPTNTNNRALSLRLANAVRKLGRIVQSMGTRAKQAARSVFVSDIKFPASSEKERRCAMRKMLLQMGAMWVILLNQLA